MIRISYKTKCAEMRIVQQTLRKRIAALGAELAALRDRQCDGCANWDPDEHTYGWCETVLDEDNPIATRPNFACNRWVKRSTP